MLSRRTLRAWQKTWIVLRLNPRVGVRDEGVADCARGGHAPQNEREPLVISGCAGIDVFSPQPQPPAGQHVVGHRVFQFGDVARGDFEVALAAHDDGFVPHLSLGNIGDVHHERVHGDAADERRALAVNEHAAFVAHAREAVAVADGQDGNAPFTGRDVSHAVTDDFAGLQFLNRRNPSLYGHDGLDAVNGPANLGGKDAIHQNARADHIQMRVGQIEQTAAVASVAEFYGDFSFRQRVQNFVEPGELEVGKGLVDLVGLREMRHDAFQGQGFFRDHLFEERQGLVPAHAVAAHAGVDFDMNRHLFAQLRRDFGEGADIVRFVEANRQVVGHAPFEFGFLPFAEQQQRGGDAAVAQRHGFFERAQAEPPGAFLDGNAGHVQRAVAVRLVFNDGEQLHGGWQIAADELQVAAQPAEINLHPRRSQRKIMGIELHLK